MSNPVQQQFYIEPNMSSSIGVHQSMFSFINQTVFFIMFIADKHVN